MMRFIRMTPGSNSDYASIDNPFSKFFNSEIDGDIGEDVVNPGSDGLA